VAVSIHLRLFEYLLSLLWRIFVSYDEHLATRIRAVIASLPDLEEKKMFGGIGFLVNGNMACGVHKNNLIVRVGAATYKSALSNPHTQVFDMTGKPMTGWVMVDPQGVTTDHDLKAWVGRGLVFARTLPPKEK
jgi:hypothetical protein